MRALMTTVFCLVFTVVLITTAESHSYGDILRHLEVPQYGFKHSDATLSCSFDLISTSLYSLKWYHNNTEFYRYVPTEREGPVNIQPSNTFALHEISRDERGVTLLLSNLTLEASGNYRCEVIAEHPSFRTETKNASMIVLNREFEAPIILSLRDTYDPDDIINIGCQPRNPYVGHQPHIQWLLNNQLVGPNMLSSYGSSADGFSGVTLTIQARKIEQMGGRARVQCRLIFGLQQKSTSKEIIVNRRKNTFMDTYYSKGNTHHHLNLSMTTYLALLSVLMTILL